MSAPTSNVASSSAAAMNQPTTNHPAEMDSSSVEVNCSGSTPAETANNSPSARALDAQMELLIRLLDAFHISSDNTSTEPLASDANADAEAVLETVQLLVRRLEAFCISPDSTPIARLACAAGAVQETGVQRVLRMREYLNTITSSLQ